MVLLTALFLAVVQLGLAVHVRNTVLDAAAEGARYAALADSGVDAGVSRTRQLIRAAFGGGVDASVDGRMNERFVEIRVQLPLPLIGFLGFSRSLDVRGHAVREVLE